MHNILPNTMYEYSIIYSTSIDSEAQTFIYNKLMEKTMKHKAHFGICQDLVFVAYIKNRNIRFIVWKSNS